MEVWAPQSMLKKIGEASNRSHNDGFTFGGFQSNMKKYIAE